MSIFAVNDKVPKFIFIINFKVMYSSLNKILPVYFPSVEFYNNLQLIQNNIKFKDFQKFAIVRNPYDRAISAFYGKCKKTTSYNLRNESAQLEYCQEQLLNAIKEIRNEDFEIAQPAIFYNHAKHPEERKLLDANFNKLISISFEEYVNCLNVILQRKDIDGHFRNQSDTFSVPNQRRFFLQYDIYKNTKIIKLENISQEWDSICQELGKNMDLVKVNKTEHLRDSYQSFYTDETRKEIARLYKKDFLKFGYSMDLQA